LGADPTLDFKVGAFQRLYASMTVLYDIDV